ncbi:MAG: DNA-binding protein AraC-type [Paenibacillus sp.]|jgi:AraC-like DNA-binding protein|nr:DNA-binding protein AraC-type [Paenibacillus sp.]
MIMKRIEDRQISPTVLTCLYQAEGMEMPSGTRFSHRMVYDYELEFFTDSQGGMMLIGDTEYAVRKGDVIFKRPGVTSQGILPYTCYLICFDMLGKGDRSPHDYYLPTDKPVQPSYTNDGLDAIPVLFQPASYEKYEFLFSRVYSAFTGSTPHSGMLLRSFLLQLLHQLFVDVSEVKRETIIPSSAHYKELKHVCEYVQTHLTAKLDLDQLSRIAGKSPAYFQKIFKQTMGESPNQYVTRQRLEAAKDRLSRTGVSVTEIALECGYDDIAYFSYAFKKYIGISPTLFRRRHRYE